MSLAPGGQDDPASLHTHLSFILSQFFGKAFAYDFEAATSHPSSKKAFLELYGLSP